MSLHPLVMEELRNHAASAVRAFRKEYNFPHAPADSLRIIEMLHLIWKKNIVLISTSLLPPGADAATIYDWYEELYMIFYMTPSSKSTLRRTNFTLAHELGHIYMKHLREPRTCKKRQTLQMEEYEADCFAAELLMPREVIGLFCSVKEAADALDVSMAAMRRRMQETGLLYAIRTCPKCGFNRIPPAANYCRKCGHNLGGGTDLRNEEERRLFDAGKLEELFYIPPKFQPCTVCRFKDLPPFERGCSLCECPEENKCLREYNQEPHPCFPDARYCDLCGAETTNNVLLE